MYEPLPDAFCIGHIELTVSVDTTIPLTLWSAAEPAVSIMAASLPMMRLLIHSFHTRLDDSAADNDAHFSRVASLADKKADV